MPYACRVPDPAVQSTPPRPPLWKLVLVGLLSMGCPVLVGLLIRWFLPSVGPRGFLIAKVIGIFAFVVPMAVW